MKDLLLLSSSRVYGYDGFLKYCEEQVKAFLSNAQNILFVPYAIYDMDFYTGIYDEVFQRLGYKIKSIHRESDRQQAIKDADVIFVGGGNTFLLLNRLYEANVLPSIKERVMSGRKYLGISAGSNIASPTICTTNDMPIVYPPSFTSLSLVPFQINPHYVDPEANSTHKGETRADRIKGYQELNKVPVLGMREGAILHIEDDQCQLLGIAGAKLFSPDGKITDFEINQDLSSLL
ncbi:MAG: dipeptidase PepE [Candidatus Abawacabacteria bacterium]|nr:dipeptidase PepE [Candidatus Abawacabacteria bacterium]